MAPPSRPRNTLLPGEAGRVVSVRPGSLSAREPAELCAHPFVVDFFFVLEWLYLRSIDYFLQSGGTRVRGRALAHVRGS